MGVEVLDTNLFRSASTGTPIHEDNVVSELCEGSSQRGSSYAYVPSQISESTMEEITDTTDPLIETLEGITRGNLVLTILMRQAAGDLFSALRQF